VAEPGSAQFRGVRASRVVETIDVAVEGHRLSEAGFWVLVGEFEGAIRAWRMADVERVPAVKDTPERSKVWSGPDPETWVSSLDRETYLAGVEHIRTDIFNGDVYQVNLCRTLSASLTAIDDDIDGIPDAVALSELLAHGNPSRYAARVVIPARDGVPGVWIVSASPELFLAIDGAIVWSSPIKGTAAPGEAMLEKDIAENVMITDLVRNDLSHCAIPGSVMVPELLGTHVHPGLTHLQSTVRATLDTAHDWTPEMWPTLLGGTYPPGSVSGAPKSSALRIIAREETAPRGPYCGTIGWIDADCHQAELAVAIRTFWWTPNREGGVLHFGTGAGITWGSVASAEWGETELKAARLIGLASGQTMNL
jgi:para-aminobenzoate synthetase component I